MIDLLPYEVKVKIWLDDLNIKCYTLLREMRFNKELTIDERKELEVEYEEALKKREWAYLELQKLKEEK